ncbi:MAG: DUF4065 domain-containing protein [Bradyrhizobium sp.]|uniref:type II toxin-antitoxin system antitoxin SocA domain-containing protein n=1 Tax=Bradyrhizobium sp. TaxID=376 RepID=UPI001D900285|nr:type II toxin-antitoxin system antitoxin SocA domain-containing protein [Bradyrhizobium sp.]MBV9565159.1 DUF4065 domain-containing protein [Bradyrhizobium sp.]
MPSRLPQLLHYVIWRCSPAELGATRLNEICWYSDVDTYRKLGRSITGASDYTRSQFGPTPKGVDDVIEALSRQSRIAVSKDNYYGRPKTMYLSRVKPDIGVFSSDEIAIVDAIADIICSNPSSASISRVADNALWEEIELGADVPIAAAAVIPGEITARDVSWAEKMIADFDAHSAPA